jgi:hypothetical protein
MSLLSPYYPTAAEWTEWNKRPSRYTSEDFRANVRQHLASYFHADADIQAAATDERVDTVRQSLLERGDYDNPLLVGRIIVNQEIYGREFVTPAEQHLWSVE